MNHNQAVPVTILLVEDNPGDVFLTKAAFAEAKFHNNIIVAEDGEVAMAILNKEAGYENVATPDLILLDLNLPKKDGRQVLKEIKEHETLRRIPVCVMTSSKAEQDVLRSYDLHTNSYLVKPVDLEQFIKVVSAIENFWFSLVVLPGKCQAK